VDRRDAMIEVVAEEDLRYISLRMEFERGRMIRKPKQRHARTKAVAHDRAHDLRNGAHKKSPASVTLRTKTGRRVITSPAKSETSLASWSQAFSSK
jgi:hypothetical protein